MPDTFVEKGTSFTSETVNLKSIQKRLGEGILSRSPQLSDMQNVAAIHNSIVLHSNVPDQADHYVSWRITRTGMEDGGHYALSLHDDILPLSLMPVSQERQEMASNLIAEIDEHRESGGFTENTKLLNRIRSEISEIPGINLQVHSYVLDGELGTGESGGHSLFLRNEQGVNLEVVVFDGVWFKIDIPLDEYFEKNLAGNTEVLQAVTKCLGFAYSPKLQYEFKFPENSQIEDALLATSANYEDYLYKCLSNWKKLEVQQVRAIATKGKNGSAILLTEDPTLSFSRNLMLSRFMDSEHAKVGDGIDFETTPVANDHEIIFSSFQEAVYKGITNQEIREEFPQGDFSEWLHLFINIDQNGNVMLTKDTRGESEEEMLRELMPQIEGVYGLKMGREISEKEALINAKKAMFKPKIDKEVALIELVDKKLARKFRDTATAALIYGSQHSMNQYEEYLKLLN